MVLLDCREEGEEVPAYLARGSDRLYKALREWASDPDLRKVSQVVFFRFSTVASEFIAKKLVDHLQTNSDTYTVCPEKSGPLNMSKFLRKYITSFNYHLTA